MYDSSSFVSLWPIRDDDNGIKWWLLHVAFQHWSCFPHKFKKTWSTSFRSHIDLAWLCNLRFDYWKTFGGYAWLHQCHQLIYYCSTKAITERFAIACCKQHPFSTNTKIMLMGMQIHKFLEVFVLSSTTVRKVNLIFYMRVISFNIINKICLNLILKACMGCKRM